MRQLPNSNLSVLPAIGRPSISAHHTSLLHTDFWLLLFSRDLQYFLCNFLFVHCCVSSHVQLVDIVVIHMRSLDLVHIHGLDCGKLRSAQYAFTHKYPNHRGRSNTCIESNNPHMAAWLRVCCIFAKEVVCYFCRRPKQLHAQTQLLQYATAIVCICNHAFDMVVLICTPSSSAFASRCIF